jgi:hypothetical protein
MGLKTFTFNSGDENIGRRGKRFKGEGGRTYRLSFAWWEGLDEDRFDLDDNNPLFTGKDRVYIEGCGYIEATHPDIVKYSKDGKPARTSIATVVVKWPTKPQGSLDEQRFKDGDYEVLPWIFGEDKYKSFGPVNEEFNFGSHDLKAQCTDTQFQKMTFTPCKASLLRKLIESGAKGKAHVDRILGEVKGIVATLDDDIARTMTPEQVKAKLAGGDNAATAVGDATAGHEIDDLVDGILDD